jgi:gas vesicle protein GvpL/GvpF
MAPSSVVYLYCLVKAPRPPRMTRVPRGLERATVPAPVKVATTLWAIAADVPLDVYGPTRLEPRLRDLEWVSAAAVAHERVVEHFARMRDTTVVPMKLFTMFSSFDKAVADVRARRGALERTMRHIAGCEEWGIRVMRSLTGEGAAPAPRRQSAIAAASTGGGTAYLLARKGARDAARAARLEASAAADEAFQKLRRLARDARLRERRPEPGPNPPLLEAAFLVTSASRARFKAEARRQAVACAKTGADLSVTGPWPAYNFVATGEDPS